jgi:hypothetical protein
VCQLQTLARQDLILMEINVLHTFHAHKAKSGIKLLHNVFAHQQASGMEIHVFYVEEAKPTLTEDVSVQVVCFTMEHNA